jgi:AsmA protein
LSVGTFFFNTTMTRKLLIAAAALVALGVVVIAGAALFLDVNQFRPVLEQQLASAVGRKVTIGTIKLSLLSGSVAVDNVSIADDPAFSTAPFVTAKSLKAGVELMPLIVSRSLRVESFVLDEPSVVLLRAPSGAWNFSSLGAAATAKTADTSSAPSSTAMNALVRKLAINNGQLTIGNRGAKTGQRVYRELSLDAKDLSYTSEFPFRLRAKTPGDGVVSLDGKAGPIDAKDAAETPVHAKLDVKHLDLAATGLIDPTSGLAGLVDLAAALASDGRRADLKGTMRAEKLRLVPGGTPARVPIEIAYDADYDLKRQAGAVKQGDVHIGKAAAHLTGTYGGKDEIALHMKLSGHQLPAPELEAALPAVGFVLPAGASIKEGTLDLDLAINGPLDRLVITGPIGMTNARIKDFDLGSKMAAIAAFGGVPRSTDTIIETFHSDVRVAPDGIKADALNMVVHSIGSLAGGGTIAPKGTMDFRMVGSLGSVRGVPFKIQGTTANPVFVPDVSAAVGNILKSPDSAIKTLGGLFGKKKK